MPRAIPVIDLQAAEAGDSSQLSAVRAATEDLGAVQVVNHGVPPDLIADLSARMARLLGLPRAKKAELATPHPYRGVAEAAQVDGQRPEGLRQRQHQRLPEQRGGHVAVHEQHVLAGGAPGHREDVDGQAAGWHPFGRNAG